MKKKRIIAMILVGGQGTRLKELTEDLAKPAVAFTFQPLPKPEAA